MKHRWRPPAFPSGKSNKFDSMAWLKFVSDSHLDWLMDMLARTDMLETPDAQDTWLDMGDAEDAEHYRIIKAQAERLMGQADAEQWTEADRRECLRQTLWGAIHAAARGV